MKIFALLALALSPLLLPRLSAAAPQQVLNFALLDHRGRMYELRRMDGRAVVLFFTANGCPIVRQSAAKLLALQEEFGPQGVTFALVNANTGDDRESIYREAGELGVGNLPVLKDDTQGVARHLGVTRTAEAVAISTKDWTVFYRGALDDQMVEGARKAEPTQRYLESALDEFLAGKPVTTPTSVARGCVIHFDGGSGPDSAPVSYARDVAPILVENCVSCHSPGNIGSWAMSDYRKVKGMASMIEEVLLSRRMPPWDADPHVGTFVNDRSLTVQETQTILRWIHQGALRGDGEDPLEHTSVPPAPDWPLGPPDIVLRLPQPEQVPATGLLDYRRIPVPANNAEPGWLRAIYVKPGNRRVIHHVIVRLAVGGNKDALGMDEMLVGWSPGATQEPFPDGSGKLMPPQAVFLVEIHYTPIGSPQTDNTEVGLYLTKEEPTRRFESVPVANMSFEIRPGDPDAHVFGTYAFRRGATLYSLRPHMHVRGKWMKFEALFPDGRRELLCSVPRYDFNWQQTYILNQPLRIPAGTWVVLSGGFDNSPQNPSNPDPKKSVFWGDQSTDEMFIGWYQVAWDPVQEK